MAANVNASRVAPMVACAPAWPWRRLRRRPTRRRYLSTRGPDRRAPPRTAPAPTARRAARPSRTLRTRPPPRRTPPPGRCPAAGRLVPPTPRPDRCRTGTMWRHTNATGDRTPRGARLSTVRPAVHHGWPTRPAGAGRGRASAGRLRPPRRCRGWPRTLDARPPGTTVCVPVHQSRIWSRGGPSKAASGSAARPYRECAAQARVPAHHCRATDPHAPNGGLHGLTQAVEPGVGYRQTSSCWLAHDPSG